MGVGGEDSPTVRRLQRSSPGSQGWTGAVGSEGTLTCSWAWCTVEFVVILLKQGVSGPPGGGKL